MTSRSYAWFTALIWNVCSFCSALVYKILTFLPLPHKRKKRQKPSQILLHTNSDNAHPITVIIPALNEAAALSKTIAHLFSTYSLPTTFQCAEPTVIVVDANSQDGTRSSIIPLLSSHPGIQILSHDFPSRGAQQNFGASQSRSPILLFLHADTLLPPSWDAIILSSLSFRTSPTVACFSLSLPHPISSSLRLMLFGANVRARYCGLPYGDQAFSLMTETFEAVGGFPDVPIMEDVELLRRIRRINGCVHVLEDKVVTSARRWIKKGVVWNTVFNQFLVLAWLCGVDPGTIYAWYYGAAATRKGKSS
ncbi:nucleotide-diphospho-sugar transferase [Cryomyces antarcticus]